MTSLAQRKSPLTQHQREMIATAVNQCGEYPVNIDDIWTIHVDFEVNVAWVHLYDGKQLPFDRNQFRVVLDSIRFQQRTQRADECEVVAVEGQTYTVFSVTSGNTYTVQPHRFFVNQRCNCLDCRRRGAMCKHQITVKKFQANLSELVTA